MTTFVLIPGACHGGWWYADVAAALHEQGHAARPVTLSGLDPDVDGVAAAISLDTHVAEAAAAVRAEVSAGSGPVVLVGGAHTDWTVHHWPTTHNVLRDGPDRLTDFLLSLAR